MTRHSLLAAGLLMLLTRFPVLAQPEARPYDLSKDPVLYTVGYAHLDTEWRWDYDATINVCLKNTLDDNFKLFEKYKPYVFTFSGARRYRMMKEYYPDRYDRLKKYVAQGRWNVGGSSVDECDANIPSPESVIRQVLYGNGFFRAEYGKESVDFLLPDCFGFQAHLPSVLAHAGLKGFSTQKLSWGSASGIPFSVGRWIGPDGKGIVAALNATSYGGGIKQRLDTSAYWSKRISENGKKYGIFADYRYYGVGDEGGAPREEDVQHAVGSQGQPGSLFSVYLASSDQLFRDLSPEQKEKLPSYTGDLLLTEHSAGSLTSQAYMKRWNRKNEQLALASEPAAVMADWLGSLRYPQKQLNDAWWLVLGSQMHDILPGTCIPKAYEYAWNDEVLALNRFASVLESSAEAVIRGLDTRGKGISLVVYNPLSIARREPAEATVIFPKEVPATLKAVDPAGAEFPVQILEKTGNTLRILFPCNIPPFGFACYDIQPGNPATASKPGLSVSSKGMENEFLKITVNADGDIASVFDKKLGKELLSAPMRLEFRKEHPAYWPAWNMDWNDRNKPPLGYVKGPATVTVTERGPVRVALRIEREARNSVFIQQLELAAGREPLVVRNTIRWQSKGVSLKATFPLMASNGQATYNLGLGTEERANNNEKKYEVPSREWFDLTDQSGNFGATVIEDCKFGSDKPDDRTLRLTLLYTPATNFYHDQATQDWGIHEAAYGLYSHKGDWKAGLSEWQGRMLNQPLRVFNAAPHPGSLGKSFSFARSSSPQVDIRAIKKGENGKDIILRLQELLGSEVRDVEITMVARITRAWEVNGQEKLLGEATVKNGKLVVSLDKFALRSFAVQLEAPAEKMAEPVSAPLPLSFDRDVVSGDGNRKDGNFDGGITFPAELFPETVVADGILFNLGSGADAKNNVVTCRGQKIILPKTGTYRRISMLAAAVTDTTGIFRIGGEKVPVKVQAFRGNVGQFDNRTWDKLGRMTGLDKGFIKRDEVAWYATHLHHDTANLAYRYGYLFKYDIAATPEAGLLQLPDNPAIRIFAISVADAPPGQVAASGPLYDDFTGRTALDLKLTKSFVTDGMKAVVKITANSDRNLAKLPGKVTMKDYADIHQPNGVTVRYYADTLPEGGTPSGWGDPVGVGVPAVNDGMYDLLPADSVNDRWSETGEGRLIMDLQKELELDSLHLFATQSVKRGGQSFSLWGASGNKQPDFKGDPVRAGWKFLALAPSEDLWGDSKVLYTVTPLPGEHATCRYLLWISEDTPHGPYYFREVDVFERQR